MASLRCPMHACTHTYTHTHIHTRARPFVFSGHQPWHPSAHRAGRGEEGEREQGGEGGRKGMKARTGRDVKAEISKQRDKDMTPVLPRPSRTAATHSRLSPPHCLPCLPCLPCGRASTSSGLSTSLAPAAISTWMHSTCPPCTCQYVCAYVRVCASTPRGCKEAK